MKIETETENRYSMGDMLRAAGAQQEHAAPFNNVLLPYVPRDDQIDGLRKMAQWKRFGLFAEARCGKTITFTVGSIYFAKYGFKTIILMPPVLFPQFSEFWGEIENNPATMKVLNDSAAARSTAIKGWLEDRKSAPDVLVMTVQIFKKHVDHFLAIGYRNLVFDESHQYLQSEENQTYAAVRKFVEHNRNNRLTLSTGTPAPNELFGVYPTISLINPVAYNSRKHFNREHVVYVLNQVGRKQFWKINGYNKIREMNRNLYQYGHRVLRTKVLRVDVPNIQVVPVDLYGPHYGLYRRLMTERVLEFGNTMINAVQAQKLRQVALQLITTPEDFTDTPPKNAVTDTVEELLLSVGVENEKVVIFANFNRSVESLRDALVKYNPAIIYGPAGPSRNGKEAERFKTDPSCRVLIANPRAGGVGLTLGKVSTTVIFAEPTSSPGEFDQAVSRTILAGQTEPVSVYLLKINGTLSPKSIKLMLRKAHEVKEVNKDPQSLLDELLGKEENK